LGGPAGGFTAGPLASPTISPSRVAPQHLQQCAAATVAASALAAVRSVEAHPELVTQLHQNARYFREQQLLFPRLQAAPGRDADRARDPGETAKAIHMSELLLAEESL